jgi:hypothetical protein
MKLSGLLTLEDKLIFLQSVNGTRIGVLNACNRTFSPRFNDVSTLTFTVYEDDCEYYNMLTSYMRIEIQDLCVFQILSPAETNNGIRKSKTITCNSLEYDFNRKTISSVDSTYNFYSIDEDEDTVMSIIMSYIPNWSIESIDSDLYDMYRTFDLTDISLYQFMMTNVEEAYECVFTFDTINRTITATAFANVSQSSDIFLSFDNLVNELEITEDSDAFVTCLEVYGYDDLSINLVNPLGKYIYNFQHFTGTIGNSDVNYMSDELIEAVSTWELLVEGYQESYANYLTDRKALVVERVALEAELTDLESEYDALEVVRDALLEADESATSTNTEMTAKQTEIDDKEEEIDDKQDEIDAIDTILDDIKDEVAIATYFSEDLYLELESFVIGATVTDESFAIGDTDTDVEIQEVTQELYDTYIDYLDTNSKLKYTFTIDLANFITHEEYDYFTKYMQFGMTITLDIDSDGTFAYPMLLGLDINLDDDSDIEFLFSEEMRYESSAMSYEDYLASEVSSAVSTISGSKSSWGEYTNSGTSDTIDNIFENGLSMDLVSIKNDDSEELTITSTGLLARSLNDDGVTYSDEQLKIVHNKIVFTDDNFDSLKTAVGKVTLPDESTAYGINAEKIYASKIKLRR